MIVHVSLVRPVALQTRQRLAAGTTCRSPRRYGPAHLDACAAACAANAGCATRALAAADTLALGAPARPTPAQTAARPQSTTRTVQEAAFRHSIFNYKHAEAMKAALSEQKPRREPLNADRDVYIAAFNDWVRTPTSETRARIAAKEGELNFYETQT